MNYKLKRSKRKTIGLYIRDGELLVRAPRFVPKYKIDLFVLEKQTWIQEKLEAYRQPGINFERSYVYLFGEKIRLDIKQGSAWSMEIDDCIRVIARSNMGKLGIEKRMEEYFKELLEKHIDKSLRQYSQALNIKTPSYIIRKYKRIHGRCLSNGELAFNTHLYEHSLEFIDYVVLHECAHLIEFNHSKRFYAIIEKHLPNFKEIIQKDKTLLSPHQDQ